VKVKTTKITLPKKDYELKLSKLEKDNQYQRIDILDEPGSNAFKINVPIFYRGNSNKFNLPCNIHIKEKKYTIEVTVYSDITKPLIVITIASLLFVSVSYLVSKSIGFSIFIFVYGVIHIGGLFVVQVRKQTRRKIREWFW
tara:strand:+ start:220 stop:642 length:423 start_codon:yes stop_codon:yes gene_type:complete